MKESVLTMALVAVTVSLAAQAAEPALTVTKLWSYTHSRPEVPGQFSEIPAFDAKTNTLWVAGVVGVDVLDAATGKLVQHIDVTQHGFVNSVDIQNGLAAFAVESSVDRTQPGVVLFYDTKTRQPRGPSVPVGAVPDMLTFGPAGLRLFVANEATPTTYDNPALDPRGSVTIIDVLRRRVIATPGFAGVPTQGENLRLITGMDFEPEYIAVNRFGTRAFVTLQEANAIGVLDLVRNRFTSVIGLGAKDFNAPGNEIDPKDNDNTVLFRSVPAKGLYMPDAVATYDWFGFPFMVLANEGDFREDDADRAAASTYGAVAPLDRLRVSSKDSSPGNLYAAGARSFSIRGPNGGLVYDSGSILDREAHARGIYADGRSRDKGVEPEGIALLEVGYRTYAFVGLERTTQSAVAVFDITSPFDVQFVDMIVTPTDSGPEGLAAYRHNGRYYLAIANENVPSNTTLYRLEFGR
jgi:DNA-binding beta-propeller fold protein YncE